MGIYVGKENSEKGARFYLEIQMNFDGISPAGRVISLLFTLVVLGMVLLLILIRAGMI